MKIVNIDHTEFYLTIFPCGKKKKKKQMHNILFTPVGISVDPPSPVNPLPDMPILDFSRSTVKKDLMSKIYTNRDTDI